jgi:membrane associated rhomboid family serine protease
MRSASVGYHCPTCVAEGAATCGSRARPRRAGRRDTSRVSLTIVALNVVVFVLGLAVGEGELQSRFGQIAGCPGAFGVADGEYYRLLTAAFLHAGVFHILHEHVRAGPARAGARGALGRLRFTRCTSCRPSAGSVLSYLLSDPLQLGVGASGAIFGLFGAYYVVVRRLGGETRSIVTLLVINLVITFTIPIIDWRAHLGGLVTGAVVAAAFAYVPRGPAARPLQASPAQRWHWCWRPPVVARTDALGG